MIHQVAVEGTRIIVRGDCVPGALALIQLPAHLPTTTDGEVLARQVHDGGPFEIAAPRTPGADPLYGRFRVLRDGVPLPGPQWPTDLSAIGAADYPFPTAPTIKGLQVHDVDDALALGVGHAALNLSLNTVLRGPGDGATAFEHDGRTFFCDEAYLARFDERVRALSERGIVVTLILLNGLNWDGVPMAEPLRADCVHPNFDPEGLLSAFPVTTDAGLRHVRAFASLVARRYTRPDARHGRACGFIVGNEVNSGWIWNNAGEMDVDEAARQYIVALRTVWAAAKEAYAGARVYASLDHLWTIPFQESPLRYYRGRDILDRIAADGASEGDFDWHLAYHPYPEDLSKPDFWNDATALGHSDTPRITFQNLEQLPAYLRRPAMLHRGRPRRILLSEQGFHSNGTPEGEEVQAAAYALAFEKVAQLPSIDAFILHAHVDHRDEFGLNLGLRRRDPTAASPNAPGEPKPVYTVFREIDGPQGADWIAWAREVAARTPRR